MHPHLLLSVRVASAGLCVLHRKDPPKPKKLPQGTPIRKELKLWFGKQRKESLKLLKSWASIPLTFPPLANYDDPMASAMAPIISGYWSQSGKAARSRLGLDPDEWRVTDPHLREKIEHASFLFCDETNATTHLGLQAALDKLHEELIAGLVEGGEAIPLLTKRVNEIFKDAETWRAKRIAVTEASRAVHQAEVTSDKESEVVAGYEWLLSGDACELCQEVADKCPQAEIGDAFAILGDHEEYSIIEHPPLHPNCQCSLVPILKEAYGGPSNPKWSETVIQPTGEEYLKDAPE